MKQPPPLARALRTCRSLLAAAVALASLDALASSDASTPESSQAPPNIVFILADDLGYGDVQAYNRRSRIPTPNLNRLASEGMMFTDAHSGSAVCTPTRYGVLTGRYCWRTRLKRGVLFPPKDEPLIDTARLTVAGLLRRHGYHTACIGKWHLGMGWQRDAQGEVDFNRPIEYGPTDTGFHEFFGIAASLDMIPYGFYRNHLPVEEFVEEQPAISFPRFVRKGPRTRGFDPGKVLDRLGDEAVTYIRWRANADRPFFLYLPLTAPHKPVWPAARFRGKTPLGPYGDFVHQTDSTVGRVLRTLDEAGITDNTLVFFTSDNGSYMYRLPEEKEDHVGNDSVQGFHAANHRANAGWRGTKADVWEAGHRVPFIVRWPSKVTAKSRCVRTICLTDFMATCAEIVGHALPANTAEDSFSLLPLLGGQDWPTPRPPVISHSANGIFALRDGPWKMVFGNGSGGREKPAGKPFAEPYFLFDLAQDPGETANLIAEHPLIAQRLTEALETIRRTGTSRLSQ